jgi:predicted DNA-binding transcriptional regulator YafY
VIAPANFDASQAVQRVLLTIEVLQRSTGPVSAGSLAMTLAEHTGKPASKRTVLRDLQALHASGWVESLGGGRRGATVLWRLAGRRSLRPSA